MYNEIMKLYDGIDRRERIVDCTWGLFKSKTIVMFVGLVAISLSIAFAFGAVPVLVMMLSIILTELIHLYTVTYLRQRDYKRIEELWYEGLASDVFTEEQKDSILKRSD